MRTLTRLRGMLGISFTWAAAFSAVGAVGGLALFLALVSGAVESPGPVHPAGYALAVVLRWAIIGALSGMVFAVTVMVAERRQTLAELSAPRFARWGLLAGGLGSAVIAALFIALVLPAPAFAWSLALGFAGVPLVGAALGRGTAAATLRAARRELPGPDLTGALRADEPAPVGTPLPRRRR